jgi:hypothetical protein
MAGSAGRHWLIGLAIAAALVGLGFVGWHYWQARELRQTDPETGCLTNSPTPHAVLFMVDATDRLSAEHVARIRSRIDDAARQLGRASRVIVLPFGGDTATPLVPIFNSCVPGNAATAHLDEGGRLLEEQYQTFQRALEGLTARLQQIPDSRTSPITEQVVRAASDPQLHWQGEARTLVLITDGLESSIYWTRNLRLPDPPEALLRGVRVEYFEVGNARGTRLQTREMRLEWKSWLERAGAEVRLTAPGFSAADS